MTPNTIVAAARAAGGVEIYIFKFEDSEGMYGHVKGFMNDYNLNDSEMCVIAHRVASPQGKRGQGKQTFAPYNAFLTFDEVGETLRGIFHTVDLADIREWINDPD